jgi:hypothetical protein
MMLDKEKAGVAAPAQISRDENADGGSIPQATLATKLNAENTLTSRWQDHEVTTFNGQYDTNIDTDQDYNTISLGEIFCLEPTSQAKAAAPAFIPSTYHRHDARNHQTQRDRGEFVALTGDVDKGDVPLDDIITHTRALFGSEAAIFIYSTGSATLDGRRWRIIVPLEEPVSFVRWNEAQQAFFSYMAANGVPMDKSLAGAAQPVYLPNIPQKRRGEDGRPLFYERYAEGEKGVPL